MKNFKVFQNNPYLILVIIFIIVSLVSLATYIKYVTNKDEVSMASVFVSKNIPSIITNKVGDVSYLQLVGGQNSEVLEKINKELKSPLINSCFGDPLDPKNLIDLRKTYYDELSIYADDNNDYIPVSKEQVSKMSWIELYKKLSEDFRYGTTNTQKVVYFKNGIFSVTDDIFEICGGPHPNDSAFGYVFDLNTGQNIKFSDLFIDYNKQKDLIQKIVTSYVIPTTSVDCEYNYTSDNYGDGFSYAIDSKGILPLSFDLPHISGYCEPNNAVVPFSVLKKYLKPKFYF